jgi:hypothetical protein
MFSVVLLGSCEKQGCTDPYSPEYDSEATKDDGSCSNNRTLSVKFSIENTICTDGQTGSLHSVNFSAFSWSYSFNAYPDVISVPLEKISDDMNVEKGENITISAERDNRNSGGSNGCGGANVLVEVYINDEVVETRTLDPGTWSSSGNTASFSYIIP